MKKLAILLGMVVMIGAGQVSAKTMVRIKTIGSSPKGQFVAFEEFGFKNNEKTAYSRIRVMNMWKNKYVDKAVNVVGTKKENNLKQVRLKAKRLAQKQLKKFDINS